MALDTPQTRIPVPRRHSLSHINLQQEKMSKSCHTPLESKEKMPLNCIEDNTSKTTGRRIRRPSLTNFLNTAPPVNTEADERSSQTSVSESRSSLSGTGGKLKKCRRWCKLSSCQVLDSSGAVDPRRWKSFANSELLNHPLGLVGKKNRQVVNHVHHQPKKSCMVIKTIDDSLRSCNIGVWQSEGSLLPGGEKRVSGDVTDISVKEKKHLVRFDCIEIREYQRTLGDNPSVSDGPPLTIGWTVTSSTRRKIDEFETERSFWRRDLNELIVPPYLREELLKDEGYTVEELLQAENEVALAQTNRYQEKQLVEKTTAAKLETAVGLFERGMKKLRRKAKKNIKKTLPSRGTQRKTATIARQA